MVHVPHPLPGDEGPVMCLDPERGNDLGAVQPALHGAAVHRLDPRRLQVPPQHHTAAVDPSAEDPLDLLVGVAQLCDSAAAALATVSRLKPREVVKHLLVVPASEDPAPCGLDLGQPQEQPVLVIPRLVLAIPTLQDLAVPAIAAMNFLHVPHHLRLLDHHRSLGLAPDGPPCQSAPHRLLDGGHGFLLLCLHHDVALIVGEDIC
mmetsp:Transcript_104049/g.301007  ORF Transcript_104049/g.301007 Transcript_104049/m.301007 type:complete len:205 (-) Transcript_104049:66-680(-)